MDAFWQYYLQKHTKICFNIFKSIPIFVLSYLSSIEIYFVEMIKSNCCIKYTKNRNPMLVFFKYMLENIHLLTKFFFKRILLSYTENNLCPYNSSNEVVGKIGFMDLKMKVSIDISMG